MRENLLINQQASKVFKQLIRAGLIIAGLLFVSLIFSLFFKVVPPDLSIAIQAETYWYVSRGSAIIGFVFLWLSMALGLFMTNKLVRGGSQKRAFNELHKFVSLLGLGFILLHALILLGDQYLQASLSRIFIPFTFFDYRPLNVGLGQIVFYLWALLVLSSYTRKKIGQSVWRIIHYVSFGAFWLALLHGITSGTDTGRSWVQMIYWTSAGSILFLMIYRVLRSLLPDPEN